MRCPGPLGAAGTKELELEILRHRLRLKEQATMAATVLPTVSRKGQDAEAMLAELEAENRSAPCLGDSRLHTHVSYAFPQCTQTHAHVQHRRIARTLT